MLLLSVNVQRRVPFARRLKHALPHRVPQKHVRRRDLELDFLVGWSAAFRARNGRDPLPNSRRAVIQALKSFYAFADRFDYLVDAEGRQLRNPALALQMPVIRRSSR